MKQPLKALVLALGLSLGAANSYALSLEPLDKDFTLQLLGSGGPISDDLRASSGEHGDEGAYAYLNGLFDGSDGLFPVTITDVPYKTSQGTKVYEQDGLTIYALGIPHGDVPCLAFRIESAEGVMVISADQNGSNPDFIDFAKGADILLMPLAIHEEADEVSSFMHAKPSVVGKIAAEVNPKLLVLNHWMGLGLKLKPASIKIVKEYYHGQVIAGHDLSSYPMSAAKEMSHEQ
ncbi:hypothetical protein QTO16_25515 [Vibrio harveyi]|uniref:hypothetical protein n=1 Tax=Vibrio harveyi TaxID=669 RepID=UPI002F4290D2